MIVLLRIGGTIKMNYQKRSERRLAIATTIPKHQIDALALIIQQETKTSGVKVKLAWVLEDLLASHPRMIQAIKEVQEPVIDVDYVIGVSDEEK